MTYPAGLLLDEEAPDAVVFTLSWLRVLAASPASLGMIRKESDPLPYWQVGLILAVDDATEGTCEATVSVHYMTTAADGVDADTLAVRGGSVTHRRMMLLARNPHHNITIGGRAVNADWLECVEKPAWRDYDDTQIARVKAVYRIGLSYTAV